MKISKVRDIFSQKHPFQLKIIRKGIFWIALNEEAFFMSKYFNMKITAHDKEHIKIGFPVKSQDRRFAKLDEINLGYILLDKVDIGKGEKETQITTSIPGKYFNSVYIIDLEDYQGTKERVLGLGKLGLEKRPQQNFLLKDKIEELYIIISQRLIKMPKVERHYFREKIERIMMDLLELIYEFMYIQDTRAITISDISRKCLIIREYTRFLYKLGKIKNDNIFLDTGEKWIEVFKIVKTLKNKYKNIN